MPKLFMDDSGKANFMPTAQLAALFDGTTPTDEYLSVSGDNSLTVSENCVFLVGGTTFRSIATVIGSDNVDKGGAFIVGGDYYVYICDNGTGSETYIISLNSTSPESFCDSNNRKIGGFHFGRCRRVNSILKPINALGVEYGDGWEANTYDGIVPRSVWTLKHRPRCAPEGMVYLGSGIWGDIYQSSDDGKGTLRSVFGGIPLTGIEGHNWYSFNDRLLIVGKRMLGYDEFCHAAYGSPQGNDDNNDNAWSSITNTERNPAGGVANAVSSIGCRDCVGNVWEWTGSSSLRAEHYIMPTTGVFPYYDGSRVGRPCPDTGNGHDPAKAWGWDVVSPLGDTTGGNPFNGNVMQHYDWSLTYLRAGGCWRNGSKAGCRAVDLHAFAWGVSTVGGIRGACESL